MIAIVYVLVAFVIIGFIGSQLEKAGIALNNTRLEAIGKVMESIANDAPKFISNISVVISGVKK